MTRLSIIVPVLNEAGQIEKHLAALAALRERGHEVIVVDGGSRDNTFELAKASCDRVVTAPRGRAAQMNAGAALASGEVFLFLHADTRLPDDADRLIAAGLASTQRCWGRFDMAIAGEHPLLPMIAWMMNRRSHWTGIVTGDQALFVRREVFWACGGFPPLALMEDIALSRCLKRTGKPLRLRQKVITSGRRWENKGVVRTILLMWRLRLAFFFGADPAWLAKQYGYAPHDG